MAPCLWLPGWASTRRNIYPPTIWSSSSLYQLLPSTMIHSILPVQITCLAIFLHNLSPRPLWSTSWSGAIHLIPYISSPSHCLLFATDAHTIATCSAVESRSSIPKCFCQLLAWNSMFYLTIIHPSNHSHLCSLKCHLIFFPGRIKLYI